jgi:hypothetical protein
MGVSNRDDSDECGFPRKKKKSEHYAEFVSRARAYQSYLFFLIIFLLVEFGVLVGSCRFI